MLRPLGSSFMPFAALALLWAQPATAQEPLSLSIVRKGQQGQSHPQLLLLPNLDADDVSVSLKCGGVQARRSGAARAGEQIALELQVPLGQHSCKGQLSASFSDGSAGEMPLSFQVELLAPLKIEVPRESVDLEDRQLQVILDRPASGIELSVFDESGQQVGAGTVPVVGLPPGAPIQAEWSGGDAEVLRIHVKGVDEDGFWAGVDLFPWSYDIPHEDVVFETAKSEIRASEEGKLQDALDQALAVIQRFSATRIEMKLYVGGYTDTVGDHGGNQALSERRAAAIAGWFGDHGFERPVFYQGFGEDALAVSTPDETDEQANRRAAYVIAAEAPPPCAEFPRSNWRQR